MLLGGQIMSNEQSWQQSVVGFSKEMVDMRGACKLDCFLIKTRGM